MRDDLMTHATAGILGGIAGAAVLRRGMKASERLPIRLQPTRARRNPDEFLITKWEQWRGKPLSHGRRDLALHALQWSRGIAGGLVLGLATSRRHVRTLPSALLAGALIGTGVWAVSYGGWLPAAKLTPPVTRQGGRHVAASILGHVVFGIVAVAPILLVDRSARAPLWKRALHSIRR